MFGSAREAQASSSFPAALQKALSQRFPGVPFCVPTCVACHLTTAGGPGNLNVFGTNLYLQPPVMPPPNLPKGNDGDVDAKVKTAINRYFDATPAASLPQVMTVFPPPDRTRMSYDSDRDGISDYDELANLDSPSIAGPEGVGQFCPSDAAQYGCFARVAAAPPPATVDRLGLFSAGLVVLGLAAFRRSKRRRRDS